MSGSLISPEDFFGFKLGSDRKIARWDKIVEYFRKLEEQSGKTKVIDLGPSTEGNPFLLVIITSENNMRNLERIREDNLKISDPKGLTEGEVEEIITEGKAIICQSMSLHATEIGGTQMAPELAYELLANEDEDTQRILNNVVFLMVPCFNPDGQIMVTDWYNKWLDTEYEGVNLPWLYHKYTGHDNNRDAFQTNMNESKYMASLLFREWIPQAYVDHHHMGSYGARLYVPPYCEPIHPNADPLIWREHSWFGAHMALKLEEKGKTGILNAAQYLAWGHLGFHWITNYHNIAGMLTESANAKLATPLYIHPNQLKGDRRRTLPEYEQQTNFPNPWPGGWWKLREIVEQQKISAIAALDLAARHGETLLRNAYLKGKRQSERGREGPPKAYVLTPEQHDPLTALELVRKLLAQGIEIHEAQESFTSNGRMYPAESIVIFLAQPKSGLIKTLLGRTIYPDNEWTRSRDGMPLRPQDTTTDTMAEFMGVRVDPIKETIEGSFGRLTEIVTPKQDFPESHGYGYALDCRLNDSFRFVNRILEKGLQVFRCQGPIQVAGSTLPEGAFIFKGTQKVLSKIAGDLRKYIHPLTGGIESKIPVNRARIGLYQRYWGGNMDEGWTRFVLEQFEFPYETIKDKDIKNPGLKERFDVIILPNDPECLITGIGVEEWWKENYSWWPLPNYPPEYRSGIGHEGVESLKKFVKKGGTLITFNSACDLTIKKFDLKVKNVLEGVPTDKFYCPGSTLRVNIDSNNPLTYGMPKESLIFFWGSPAFEIIPSEENDRYELILNYPKKELLQSGWLIGEETISGKAAMISASYGEGRILLYGFRPQHRAQTHGTYKLVFNPLFV
jgi:hypothetical protein